MNGDERLFVTTTTNDFTLSAKDICAIIKSCSEAGVSKLDFGDLSVSFKGKASEIAEPVETRTHIHYAIPNDDSKAVPQISDDEVDLQLAVENPAEWERRQIEGNNEGS